MEMVVTDLRFLLDGIREEREKEKITKGEASRRVVAKGFMDLLSGEGARVLEPGRGKYFCAEIMGSPVAISPFGSHEGFWDKVSNGIRSLYAKYGCRWGLYCLSCRRREESGLKGTTMTVMYFVIASL
jgi:hypothetical protein